MSRRPKLRSIGISAAVSAALLLAFAPVTASASPIGALRHAPRVASVGGDPWRLFKATNESRARFDVPKLRLNRELSASPGGTAWRWRGGASCSTPRPSRALPAGRPVADLGRERRATRPGASTVIQRAFMASPPHRGNILNRSFRQVAIGAVRVDGMLWVTVFFYG